MIYRLYNMMANVKELNDEILLTGTFFLYPKSKDKYKVVITNNSITWSSDSSNGKTGVQQTDFLLFSDVLGCDCMKGKVKNDHNAYLTVYAYPHKKKFGTKKTLRKRQTFIIAFDTKNNFEDNCKDAEPWKSVITCLSRKINLSSQDIDTLEVPTQKKLLVLVNPFSGPGKALTIFQQRAVPILAEANIHFSMIVTEHAGHAYKLVQTLNLDQWYGIVIVSGDGLIYEVINGLMQRDDWQEAIKITLGCLPGGSGNALCAALLYAADEPYLESGALHAAFAIAKHSLLPMDIVGVETSSNKQLFSFLSLAWGIIADVDIESERFRSLGPVRFTMGAVVRIINLRKYRGRLSFLATEPYHPPKVLKKLHRSSSEYSSEDANVKGKAITRSKSTIAAVHLPEEETKLRSVLDESDNAADSQLQKVVFDNDEKDDVIDAASSDKLDGTTGEIHQRINLPLLPPLNEPVPSDWTVIEDDFILVAGVYQTHLSADMISTPQNRIDDGLIHLGFIRAGISRPQLVKIMTAMETGEHVGMDGLENVPVKAFRLEPLGDTPGILTVDGEKIDYGPVQAQIMPGLARIMALPPKDTR